MAIDVDRAEIQLLLRQFERGDVVLFAGAGFSLGARNVRHEDPPLGKQLATLLAGECGWTHEDEDLPTIFAQAESHLGTRRLRDFLATHYRDCTPAPWHLLVPQLYWYRIYTTNIDDVIEQSYTSPRVQALDPIVCPSEYREPDVWCERVQCVHLHGYVNDASRVLTFTYQDFAAQTAAPSPWYQSLIDDLYARSVVFVGTRLGDPPFQHYLQLRTQRPHGVPERRAKAFVVTPSISSIWRRQYEDQGFAVIDASAEEFFTTLNGAVSRLVPDRQTLLKNRYPHQVNALATGVLASQADLLRQFDYVTVSDVDPTKTPRSYFYMGAEPDWEDITRGIDAERDCYGEFFDDVTADSKELRLLCLVGHAGSGKSTMLRRLAYEVARAGHTVYYSKASTRIDPRPIIQLASTTNRRLFFFLDDLAQHLDLIDALAADLPPEPPVTIVGADRPQALFPRLASVKLKRKIELEMPPLTRGDTEKILDKLEKYGYLGALQGRSRPGQINEFLIRSRKQLLVALKEATSGRGFDIIIADEYARLGTEGARLAYTIACFAFRHGAPIRRRYLLACLDGTDVERMAVLRDQLRGVVVRWNDSEELLSPRHRVIAREVIRASASAEVKWQALLRFLVQISAEITPENVTRRTPEYLAFRGLINFDELQFAFGDSYDTIASLYGELQTFYGSNFLYWLQRGRAEVYFDNFDIGENYLQQSLGIRDNYQAWHYMGVLFLKRAYFEEDPVLALDCAKKGEEILRAQIMARGATDSYPAAALVEHKLRYLDKHSSIRRGDELEELLRIAKEAHERHPMDKALTDAYRRVWRAYLMQTVPRADATGA